jgi:hypothetical protein
VEADTCTEPKAQPATSQKTIPVHKRNRATV